MTTLIRPDNKQPAPYVTSRNGHICLRTDCLSPSVMWFSDAAMNKLNPVYTCEPPPPVQGCALPPYMTDNMLALVEVLSTRNPERQASRDLYVYELGYQIADALAA